MNILIVDDEQAVRETVLLQLREMQLQVNRIDSAKSAEDARQCMRTNMYEIVLCDIVMPAEDGISFAKWALKTYPDMKFVFLTAHADFKYMKEAISMQSFDYLLQPASREELRSVVERAMAQVKIEKKNKELIRKGDFFFNHEEMILEEGALKYIKDRTNDNEYLRYLIASRNNKRPGETFYIPILVEILHTQKRLDEMEDSLLRSIYQNILDEVIGVLKLRVVVMMDENKDEFLVLLCMSKEQQVEKPLIMSKLEMLCDFFQKLLLTTIALYCGRMVEPQQIKEEYQNLMQARKDNISKTEGIFQYTKKKELEYGYSFREQFPLWQKLIHQNEYQEFYRSVVSYLRRYEGKNTLTQEYMITFHQMITELLLSHMVERSIDSANVFDAELSYLQYMECWETLEEFDKGLSYVTDKLYHLLPERSGDILADIKKLISQNMDKDISVTELAEQVGLNPEYLTKLFKKKSGYTLKEYIVNEKLNAAKMLLTTTQLPVTIIAGNVGYGNYSNFSRSFRQTVGCTPLEYRKENQKMQ